MRSSHALLFSLLAFASGAACANDRLRALPIVSPTEAPSGTETLAVQWVKVTAPDLGVMLAGVARPSGAGPFPTVVLLHGTHGFAHEDGEAWKIRASQNTNRSEVR